MGFRMGDFIEASVTLGLRAALPFNWENGN